MSTKPSLQPALHRTQIALDKMPHGSVVLDRFGHAWQQSSVGMLNPVGSGCWYRAYGDSSEVSSWELAQLGPVTLLAPAR